MTDALGHFLLTLGVGVVGYGLGFMRAATRVEDPRQGGNCEVCGEDGMVCLNGQRIFCWQHYVEHCQLIAAVKSNTVSTSAEGNDHVEDA